MDWIVELDEDEINYIPELTDVMSQGEVKGFMTILTEEETGNPMGLGVGPVGLTFEHRDYQSEGFGFSSGGGGGGGGAVPTTTSQPVGFLGCLDDSSALGHLCRQRSRNLVEEIGQAEPLLSSAPVLLETPPQTTEQAAKGFLDFCSGDPALMIPGGAPKDVQAPESSKDQKAQRASKKAVLSKGVSKLSRKKKKDGTTASTSSEESFFTSTSLEIPNPPRTNRTLHSSDSFQTVDLTFRSETEPHIRTSQSFATTPISSRNSRSPPAHSPKSPEDVILLKTPPGNRISSPPNISFTSSPPQQHTGQRRRSMVTRGTKKKEQSPEPLTEQEQTKRTKSGGSFKSPVLNFRSNESAPFLSLPKTLSGRVPSPKSQTQRGRCENRSILAGHPISEPVGFFSHLVQRVHRMLPVEAHDPVVGSIIDLSGQADDIFIHCLHAELEESPELSVVMRQASPAVLVLKTIARPILKSITVLASPLARFGRRLDDKAIELIGSEKRTKQSTRLKEKLENILGHVLNPKAIPMEICVLSYRCVECIKQSNQRLRESVEIPLQSWAVGAMLFLRYLVPMLTTFLPSDDNKKGRILMGRFLMKMACHSEFQQNSTGLLNEILASSYERYDQFCAEVCRIGEENFPYPSVFGPSHSPYPVGVDQDGLERLRDFFKEVSEDPLEMSDEWKGGLFYLSKKIQDVLDESAKTKLLLPDSARELTPPPSLGSPPK